MVICVAVEGEAVAPYFESSPEFAFFLADGDEPNLVKTLPHPGHKPGALPAVLREWGVTHVVAGEIEPATAMLFYRLGIEIYAGVEGDAEGAVESLLKGELVRCEVDYGPHDCGGCGHAHSEECGHPHDHDGNDCGQGHGCGPGCC